MSLTLYATMQLACNVESFAKGPRVLVTATMTATAAPGGEKGKAKFD